MVISRSVVMEIVFANESVLSDLAARIPTSWRTNVAKMLPVSFLRPYTRQQVNARVSKFHSGPVRIRSGPAST